MCVAGEHAGRPLYITRIKERGKNGNSKPVHSKPKSTSGLLTGPAVRVAALESDSLVVLASSDF